MSVQSLRRADQRGFTIIEMSVALAIFSLLSVLFASQLVTNYRVYGKAKERTSAEQIASRSIERSRQLAYNDVGVVGGTPPGLLPATSTETLNGQLFTVTHSVELVDDPVPGSLTTVANYKRLRVVVKSAGVVLSDLVTVISSTDPAVATNALMRVAVADFALNRPLVNASVSVTKVGTSGPGASVSRLTDVGGRVEVTGLTPTDSGNDEHYVLSASLSGYQIHPNDLPPSPAVRTTFGPNQVFDTTIRMFKTVSMTIKLVKPNGSVYTAPTYVWIESDRGGEDVLVTGGTLTITTMRSWAGAVEPIYPFLSVGAWWASSYDGSWNPIAYGDPADYTQKLIAAGYPTATNTVFTIRMVPYTPPPTTLPAVTTTTVGPPPVTGPTTTAPATTVPPTTTPPATTTTQPVGM
jgi:prepilin-type N-terminal cleavage/methylation domain-containing protein